VLKPHSLRPQEAGQLADLIGSIFGLSHKYSNEQMIRALRRPTSARNSWVIADNDKVLSHIRVVYDTVSVHGCRFGVASIGCVATLPEYRGQGYAGTILDMLLEQMEAKGTGVLIVSGDRGLYRRVHCVPSSHLLTGNLRAEAMWKSTKDVSVRLVDPGDWPLLAPLYQGEPVRFIRRANFIPRLPFWWNFDRPNLWLVEKACQPAAYVLLSKTAPEAKKQKSVVKSIREYAGSRVALVEVLPAICAKEGLEELRFSIPRHDMDFALLLRERGVKLGPKSPDGTIRIVNFPRLMRRLRPYIRERLPDADLRKLRFEQERGRHSITYGEETQVLSPSETTWLVLGGTNSPSLSGELERVLQKIFPIPFPMPGFNYI